MKIERLTGIAILILILVIGCSGTSGKLKTQSKDESKVTQQELIDNWSDFDIRFKNSIIVFDPVNDNRKILVNSYWGTVKDQETWERFVNENIDNVYSISPLMPRHPLTRVREIWGPDNQLYGFIIHQRRDGVSVILVEEDRLRLHHHIGHYGGP